MSEQNYQQAFEELQQIVSDIEDGQISVDELSDKVSRASTLIKICKAKLTSTEDDVKKILETIEQTEEDTDTNNSEADPTQNESGLPF